MDLLALPKHMVLDGGLSTELAWTHGFRDIDDDPLWSARLIKTNPAAIKKVSILFYFQ